MSHIVSKPGEIVHTGTRYRSILKNIANTNRYEGGDGTAAMSPIPVGSESLNVSEPDGIVHTGTRYRSIMENITNTNRYEGGRGEGTATMSPITVGCDLHNVSEPCGIVHSGTTYTSITEDIAKLTGTGKGNRGNHDEPLQVGSELFIISEHSYRIQVPFDECSKQ